MMTQLPAIILTGSAMLLCLLRGRYTPAGIGGILCASLGAFSCLVSGGTLFGVLVCLGLPLTVLLWLPGKEDER